MSPDCPSLRNFAYLKGDLFEDYDGSQRQASVHPWGMNKQNVVEAITPGTTYHPPIRRNRTLDRCTHRNKERPKNLVLV